MNKLSEYREQLREQILEQVDFSKEMTDAEIQELIDTQVLMQSRKWRLSLEDRKQLRKELFYAIRKLDLLQELLETPAITEIMINGTEHIFVEKEGVLSELAVHFESVEKLNQIIQQIVAACNRVVNEASPIVDARLAGGERVNVVLSPVALNGPIITIRRFPDKPITMQELLERESINEEVCNWLGRLVKAGYNILISGGTGSGKTTFLNVLAEFITRQERVITIEDSAELQIRNIPNLVSLETRNANVEGCRPITMRDLIKTALRMRPDRLLIGEVRGGEAVDMLQALNTGHSCMSTGHANSATDMLSRLETMTLMGMDLPLAAVRKQIVSAIDVIVHLGRMRDKSRRVLEIVEVLDYVDGEIQIKPIYQFEEQDSLSNKVQGVLVKKGELQHVEKLKAAGLY